ncbi:hypothetical protein QR680_000616 [Steinernema hermaphroditum]|uniref:G-protein coupled receptors family 1 profile domain-containing protein n=1 Tax=Steinernema hermaphroditum TaxID=289476 RepID=A0AA39LEL6_9BILA|nr:hypothetical protein QR680_000616 [Steinernema hermaphroditum]
MLCENDPVLFEPNSTTTLNLVWALGEFSRVYNTIHPFLCTILCPLGILANCVHILVLTRRRMRRSSINWILIGIAVCDILTMTSYFVYILKFEIYTRLLNHKGISFVWATILRIHASTSIALHSITLYLCVTMAFIRWKAMRTTQSKLMKPKVITIMYVVVCSTVLVLCVPTYMVHEVKPVPLRIDGLIQYLHFYTVDISHWAVRNQCRYFKANLWIIGIFLKAIPCLLLLWFTVALMIRLRANNAKRDMLLFHNQCSKAQRRKRKNYDRTTFTLIVMLTMFLLTELPQGVLTMLNGIYTNDVHTVFYMNLANVLDLLSLINCYVGFIAYCFLCSKYRQTFLMMIMTTMEQKSSNIRYETVERSELKSLPLLSKVNGHHFTT